MSAGFLAEGDVPFLRAFEPEIYFFHIVRKEAEVSRLDLLTCLRCKLPGNLVVGTDSIEEENELPLLRRESEIIAPLAL